MSTKGDQKCSICRAYLSIYNNSDTCFHHKPDSYFGYIKERTQTTICTSLSNPGRAATIRDYADCDY